MPDYHLSSHASIRCMLHTPAVRTHSPISLDHFVLYVKFIGIDSVHIWYIALEDL